MHRRSLPKSRFMELIRIGCIAAGPDKNERNFLVSLAAALAFFHLEAGICLS